jgi:hypothetical protein
VFGSKIVECVSIKLPVEEFADSDYVNGDDFSLAWKQWNVAMMWDCAWVVLGLT